MFISSGMGVRVHGLGFEVLDEGCTDCLWLLRVSGLGFRV